MIVNVNCTVWFIWRLAVAVSYNVHVLAVIIVAVLAATFLRTLQQNKIKL